MSLPACVASTPRWLVKSTENYDSKPASARTQSIPTSPASAVGLLSPSSGGYEVLGLPTSWVPVKELDATFGGESTVLLEDRKVLAELSESMVGQLNNMYTFMNQALLRERARHASDVSLMMRKVDKDLKDTFRSVRDTFQALTDQLLQLVREVENGRKQVKSIQSKYAATKQAADAQSQYVAELEAVIDSQGAGVTDVLQKLSSQASVSAQALTKAGDESKQRERYLHDENHKLRMQLKKYEQVQKNENSLAPPQLPEMSASWTRRVAKTSNKQDSSATRAESPTSPSRPSGHRQSNAGSHLSDDHRPTSQQSTGGVSFGACDVVGSMLAHSDAGRNVTRTKYAKPQPRAISSRGAKSTQREISGLRKRAETAESHCQRQHRLIGFSSASLLLLRDIFNELKYQHCIGANDGNHAGEVIEMTKAPEILERIIRLFYAAIPKLGNFSEIVSALNEEISRPLPFEISVNDSIGLMEGSRATVVTSVSVHSAPSDSSDALPL